MADWMEELERLAELRDKGLITDEEFEVKRREIINVSSKEEIPDEETQEVEEVVEETPESDKPLLTPLAELKNGSTKIDSKTGVATPKSKTKSKGPLIVLLLIAVAITIGIAVSQGGDSSTSTSSAKSSDSSTEAQQLEPTPTPTAIPMHPEWTANNIYESMMAIKYDWPWNVEDYYTDRIYNDCGGSRMVTESTFRHYKYQGEPRLYVTDVRIYLNDYVAEVEWYFEGGRNRVSTVYFEIAENDMGYRTSTDYRRPHPFRLDSYWPSGMEDFC